MQYKVVPFNRAKFPDQALQSIIEENAVDGWKYKNHEYSDKLFPGNNGCFGIGATPNSINHVGFVVFEK